MDKNDFKNRTKSLAVETARIVMKLQPNVVNKVYIGQVVRSSSSAGSNYRSACRAKSKKDFVNNLRIVEEELDETQ